MHVVHALWGGGKPAAACPPGGDGDSAPERRRNQPLAAAWSLHPQAQCGFIVGCGGSEARKEHRQAGCRTVACMQGLEGSHGSAWHEVHSNRAGNDADALPHVCPSPTNQAAGASARLAPAHSTAACVADDDPPPLCAADAACSRLPTLAGRQPAAERCMGRWVWCFLLKWPRRNPSGNLQLHRIFGVHAVRRRAPCRASGHCPSSSSGLRPVSPPPRSPRHHEDGRVEQMEAGRRGEGRQAPGLAPPAARPAHHRLALLLP